MTDDLILLMTRRASGQNLSDQDQERLEAALVDDPELIDMLLEAQNAATSQTPLSQHPMLIWVRRAGIAACFMALFSVGIGVGGLLVSGSQPAMADGPDHTFTRGLSGEKAAVHTIRRSRS